MNGLKGRNLEEAIELYKTVGYRNVDFLFHWISDIYDFFYLPLIDLDYKDVVFLDIKRPEMDGLEVLRGIKSRMVSYEKGTVSNSVYLHLKTMPLEKKLGGKKITAHLYIGRRMQRTARVQDFKSYSIS